MSACVPVRGLWGVSCEVSCRMDFKTCGCGRFRVWGGWSLESDDETEEKLSFFFPPAFLSRARALKAKCQVRKFQRSWIMVTWDF